MNKNLLAKKGSSICEKNLTSGGEREAVMLREVDTDLSPMLLA